MIDGSEIYSGVSIGAVTRAPEHTSANDLLRDAETTMYEAKRLGRGRMVAFTPELRTAADDELQTQMLGRRAVTNREFHLHWQPIFDTQTGEVTACEALLRWRPAGGANVVSAAEFIPFLESSGLIVPVGNQVIEQAFQQYQSWSARADIDGDIPISMNVSARQLESGGVVDALLHALDESGTNPTNLIIEIPEAILGNHTEAIVSDLHRLRAQGVRIAIDDFGGGQASLTALTDFPMDIVKIDRATVGRIVTGQESPLLNAIQHILKSQGLTAIATGVEDQEQLYWLQRREWEWVQGYFLAKPAAADEISKLLVARSVSITQQAA